jgi:hypothetical protein
MHIKFVYFVGETISFRKNLSVTLLDIREMLKVNIILWYNLYVQLVPTLSEYIVHPEHTEQEDIFAHIKPKTYISIRRRAYIYYNRQHYFPQSLFHTEIVLTYAFAGTIFIFRS